ncbi:MAG: Zn-ribbon domain-containing OB-fold protein [Acidimicrobiales bacterium]
MTELPVPSMPHLAEAARFWQGVAAGTFLLERCRRCTAVVWYPRGFCPACGSPDVELEAASGEGTVYSFSVVHRGSGEYRGREPYVVAYVELAEGPRVLTNIVGCDPGSVTIGARVRMVFEHGEDGSALYRFTPA